MNCAAHKRASAKEHRVSKMVAGVMSISRPWAANSLALYQPTTGTDVLPGHPVTIFAD
jgi:hypothetical protein